MKTTRIISTETVTAFDGSTVETRNVETKAGSIARVTINIMGDVADVVRWRKCRRGACRVYCTRVNVKRGVPVADIETVFAAMT